MKVKLIGAKTYSIPSMGVMKPMALGDVVDLPEAFAKALLKENWVDALGNVHYRFSADESAEVTYEPAEKIQTMEESLEEIRQDRKATQTKAPQKAPAKSRSRARPATST